MHAPPMKFWVVDAIGNRWSCLRRLNLWVITIYFWWGHCYGACLCWRASSYFLSPLIRLLTPDFDLRLDADESITGRDAINRGDTVPNVNQLHVISEGTGICLGRWCRYFLISIVCLRMVLYALIVGSTDDRHCWVTGGPVFAWWDRFGWQLISRQDYRKNKRHLQFTVAGVQILRVRSVYIDLAV
jgi:hypothetical protein